MFGNKNPKTKKVWAGFLIEKVSAAEAEAKRNPAPYEIDEEVEQEKIDAGYVYLFFGHKVENTWDFKFPILAFVASNFIPVVFCLWEFINY
jgi:hypothetical protein